MVKFIIFCLSLIISSTWIVVAVHPPHLDGRVVGGTDAKIEEAPYQVGIQYHESHWCGGSIINKNTIISAAHCFEVWDFDMFQEVFQLRIGSTFSSKDGEIVKLNNIIVHPKFVSATYDFDVAILKLASELTFGPTIQPIALVKSNHELPYGKKGLLTGWGRLHYQGALPEILQKLPIEILDPYKCRQTYEELNPITSRMFCAGTFAGHFDSCHGDSGGPLIHNKSLIGIVSWGYACALPNFPGVYTNVADLREWIDNNIE